LLGLPVVKIIRLRIGTLKLGSLKPRQWRHLTEEEVKELKGEKVPTMDRRFDRGRTSRPAPSVVVKRNPKDRPKRVPDEKTRPAPTERKTNQRPSTTDRPNRGPNARTRSNTKPRNSHR
jgi:23S rRNA pseudouridine2605 synthase